MHASCLQHAPRWHAITHRTRWLPPAGASGEVDWSTTIAPLDAAAAPGADSGEVSAASTTSTVSPPTVAVSTIKYNEGLAASASEQRACCFCCVSGGNAHPAHGLLLLLRHPLLHLPENYTKDDLAKMVSSTQAAVATAKAALAEALKDVDAAWARYTTQYKLADLYPDQARKEVFKANLLEWQRLNQEKNDDLLAYGITQFAHLTLKEFESNFLMNPTAMSSGVCACNTALHADRMQAAAIALCSAAHGCGLTAAAATPAVLACPCCHVSPAARVASRAARRSATRGLLQGSTPCGTSMAAPAWPGWALPTSWDWSSSGVITPVKNQGGVSRLRSSVRAHAALAATHNQCQRLLPCCSLLCTTVRQLLRVCHGRRARVDLDPQVVGLGLPQHQHRPGRRRLA